ncbi:hypothetical protein [Fodinicola feengrottensis]|nr:hypothetical protein [Fodinicola feengrottensis]
MTALGRWMWRWSPVTIHRALLAGAAVHAVADSAALTVVQLAAHWRQWADEQRRLHTFDCRFGMPPDEYTQVCALFAAAGADPHLGAAS